MKVRLSIPGASLTVDMEEKKAVGVFRNMARELLISTTRTNSMKDIKEKGLLETVGPEKTECEALADAEETGADEKMDTEKSEKTAEEPKKEPEGILYKGFMHLECPDCKQVSSFFKKEPKDHFHCKHCGKKHVFTEELVPMWVNCDCGKTFKYMTNRVDPMFDIACVECGSLVTVKWNGKKKVYDTLGQ